MSALSTESRPVQIAILATSFGFGPASKAYSIGRVLTQAYGIDVHYYGTGSALDFFHAQESVRALQISAETLERDPSFLRPYTSIVNVLAPEFIGSREIAEVTYYVDSLGFMWQEADVPEDSLVRHVRAYFAQDLFGSVDNLGKLGVPRVTSVSGIVSAPLLATEEGQPGKIRGLVNLGGLSNPAGTESADAYLPLVDRLLGTLQDGTHELSVAMNCVASDFPLSVGRPPRCHSGLDFQEALTRCDIVFSSPGLTTLIETSQAGKAYVPLPPQNWSQVVICEHMNRLSTQDIWRFLTAPYTGIDPRAEEASKAAAVREINRKLATDSEFVLEFGRLAQQAAQASEIPTVGNPFQGAEEIAAFVAADLGATWFRDFVDEGETR